MPLVRSFWLGKKKGKERYVEPIPEGKRIRFEIRGPHGTPREGTVGRNGAVCLLCGTPVPLAYIRAEGKAGRMAAQLMAIAAEGNRQRVYLPPNDEHEAAANVGAPLEIPETELPRNPRDFKTPNYGMVRHADLFTDRQLTTLITLCDLVETAHSRIEIDAAAFDGDPHSYADAVTTYLALGLSKIEDRSTTICTWDSSPSKETTRSVFARQAIPMTWDFAEGSPFNRSSGNLIDGFTLVSLVVEAVPAVVEGQVNQHNAQDARYGEKLLVSTDPPYYDNVGYADLSDFFYIWLRRCLRRIYPELFSTLLTPKASELIADPYRHSNKWESERFFRNEFALVSLQN